MSYVGWVCWFSTLLREVFLRVLRFSPLIKNQHLIRFDLIWVDLSSFEFIWFAVSPISRARVPGYKKWDFNKVIIIIIIIIIVVVIIIIITK